MKQRIIRCLNNENGGPNLETLIGIAITIIIVSLLIYILNLILNKVQTNKSKIYKYLNGINGNSTPPKVAAPDGGEVVSDLAGEE